MVLGVRAPLVAAHRAKDHAGHEEKPMLWRLTITPPFLEAIGALAQVLTGLFFDRWEYSAFH